jgi:hypothetical protein
MIYSELGAQAYLLDIGEGTLTFHAAIQGAYTIKRLKHFREVFLNLTLEFEERGMKHIDTWVEVDHPEQLRFAEFFGFRETGYLKEIEVPDVLKYTMLEMRMEF